MSSTLATVASSASAAPKRNIVMIAGRPSHGPGDHEHNAGILLLKKCLDTWAPQAADVKAYLNALGLRRKTSIKLTPS